MPTPPKPFGRRAPPEIKPKPPAFHAPQGLGGPEPNDPRRLRSLVIVLTVIGLGTLATLWLTERNRCQEDDADAACHATGHGGGGGHGAGGSYGGGSGGSTADAGANSSEGSHGAAFGGFGGTGEAGAHSGGGGHGGGGGE
jgi:hypothetical protein